MAENTQSRSGTPARAGVLDLLHLGAALGVDKLKGKKSDPAAAGRRWADKVMSRDGGGDIDLPVVPIELVGNREHSNQVLSSVPDLSGFEAGKTKTEAMSFLAPGALTIANGDAWRRLRPFNEQVLGTGSPHQYAQTFLTHVRSAFAAPVHNEDDIRTSMGRAMVRIVLGDVSPQLDPAGDVTKLFGVVQSPIRRKLLGFLYRRRRERLYDLIARKWEHANESSEGVQEHTLLAMAAHHGGDADRTTLLQQVPHWMFTFTGSGTDLLTRALCLITSRPRVHARVKQEIHACGLIDEAQAIGRLAYLDACILEAGRLFPPVTKTFHQRRSTGDGRRAGEYAHYFPILQRDDSLGPTVHDFRPERWLETPLDAAAAASNLFLRGPRACPGMDLILFVCKAAIARQIAELNVSALQERLARAPLPISFPKVSARFTTSG
ncbi:MAG TPA: cytochrome P450 [Gemmatimonadaceae bacterium]|jgi:cytochrome P450